MSTPKFNAINPVLPVRNVAEAIQYYSERLGFSVSFADSPENPHYAGVSRDGITLHLQWHDESSFELVEKLLIRFRIEGVDDLFDEYKDKGVFHENTALRDTEWGTREFAFYDPDMNGLIFYRDLV